MLSDLSGLSGPRLGFGMDSGWSHLSGSSHTFSPGDSMSIDFDKIAEDAVNEEFGFRRGGGGRVLAARHPVRAANRRAARRDYNRGGWGSPGWQAAQAGGGGYEPAYEEPAYEEPAYEEEYLEEGDDGVDLDDMSEDEYGAYLAAYGEEDEFGRFRPVRRARQRARRQNRRTRKQGRRSQRQPSPSFAAPEPSGGHEEEPIESDLYFFDNEGEEDSYGEYQPSRWHQRRGGPVVAAEEAYGEYQPSRWHQRRGGPVVAAEEAYGNDLPVPRQSTFRQSLDTGLGFGLGFLGVAVGLNILASALGGRR